MLYAGIMATVGLALIGATWRTGSIVGSLKQEITQLGKTISRLTEQVDNLRDDAHTVETRVALVEYEVHQVALRVANLEQKCDRNHTVHVVEPTR